MSTLIKNLQIKTESDFLIAGLPEELELLKKELPLFNDTQKNNHDFIMIFAEKETTAKVLIAKYLKLLTDDGLFWFCYPKKSSKKYKSDITRDSTWALFESYNFRPVRQISIDDDWSALRFRDCKYVKSKYFFNHK
jgi:hypothetical protein